MATESGKPLPELPDVPITRLSVNARAHRAKFIRWLFQNEGSVEADYKEEWSCLFEDSLESLSESVAHGGWLASAWSRKRDADGPNGAINQDSEASTGSEPVKFASLASTDVLQDLRDRIKTPPSTPTAKHLVLCLSGPSRLTDEEDGGYDFVPTNIGCVFRSGHFNVSDSNASFLYGTDKWDHTFSKGPFTPKSPCFLTVLTKTQRVIARLLEGHLHSRALQIETNTRNSPNFSASAFTFSFP